jgi:hypothetical protein
MFNQTKSWSVLMKTERSLGGVIRDGELFPRGVRNQEIPGGSSKLPETRRKYGGSSKSRAYVHLLPSCHSSVQCGDCLSWDLVLLWPCLQEAG